MINLEQARELLAKAVETQGKDFTYNVDGENDCLYRPAILHEEADEGDPRLKTGCLVGEALKIHGETRHLDVTGSVYSLVDAFDDLMDREAMRYLQAAQTKQDRGLTWGQAFDAAEGEAKALIEERALRDALS